jgi:hypothetical protein
MAEVVGADTDALNPKNHQRFIDQVDAINNYTKGFPQLTEIVPVQRTKNDKTIADLVGKVSELISGVHTFEKEMIFKGGWKVTEQRWREELVEEFALDSGNEANGAFDNKQ